jgi:hypothetical protein
MLKRGLTAVCIALIGCALAPAVKAQVADLATDRELFAAYCIGATRALAERPTLKQLGIDAGPAVAEGEQETKEILDRELARLREYLAARGFLSGSRSGSAGIGVRLAIKRGQSDAARCFAKIDLCVSKCSESGLYRQKCIAECRDEEAACRTTARCHRDDQLPF